MSAAEGTSIDKPQVYLVTGGAGMLERAELLGGTLSIESDPGRGTTVAVEIPFTR
jgi:signal transduction histidine kinase